MIEKNENDILFSTKKECGSPENDIYVNVDNFVEIGDFFGGLGWISSNNRQNDVEKSINGFKFTLKLTSIVRVKDWQREILHWKAKYGKIKKLWIGIWHSKVLRGKELARRKKE